MAPFAALLAGRLPHAPFGTLIGGMVVLLNGRILLRGFGASDLVIGMSALIVGLCVAVLAFNAWKRESREGVEHSFYEENEL
jgi:ABC-type transporter Mla maintaining outer membrane lipid asymmetry permease subunit MlaE